MKSLTTILTAGISLWCALSCPADSRLLYDNGPFVTARDAGSGGADLSLAQDPLGNAGWSMDLRRGHRLADDFTVPAGGWQIGRITLFGYQTYSGTTPTITNLALQIWNGPPTNPASSVVWGDLATGRLTAAAWTHVYRRLTNDWWDPATRPVMRLEAAVDVTLPTGTYWLDFTALGLTVNGPYCPPANTNDPCIGNALAFRDGAWQAVTNSVGQALDFPFVLEETVASEWGPMAALPVAVSGAAAQLVGSKFYVLGGEESPRAMQVYDLLTGAWTSDPNGLPEAISHASAVALGADLYVVGGDSSDVTVAPLRVLHTGNGAWETIASDPLPRNPAGVGCAVLDGKVYAFGGEFDTTAFRYDPAAAAGSRWTALASAPAQLMNASVAAVNGQLCVGANTAGNGRQVFVYDPSADSWAELPQLAHRHAGGRLWGRGGRLYVGGGAEGPYVASYNTSDGTNGVWRAEAELPAGRELFAFAQSPTGSRLLAGGLDASGNVSATSAFMPGVAWNGGGLYEWSINDATGSPGVYPGWSLQGIEGPLIVAATGADPFTVRIRSLTPPANNPGLMANFSPTQAYSWPVASATGGIIGFAPDKFVLDTSGLANDLGGGTLSLAVRSNTVTLNFAPAGNRAPVANPNTLDTVQNEPAQITAARLLANDRDPDGDPLTLTGVSAGSANGGAVTKGSAITYTPPAGFVGSDSFTYSISDGRGGTATASVTVAVRSGASMATVFEFAPGGVTVGFVGVPGWRYEVQRATAVEGPWSVIFSTDAPASGVFSCTDAAPPNPAGYYRLRRSR